MRTVATFRRSAFNSTEAKEHFINPCCFGDDLAKWMIQRLRQRGIQTDDEPGQEDFGWYFNFDVREGQHCCVLGFRPRDDEEEGNWIAWLERSRGLFGSLLGGRDRGIAESAVNAINGILAAASEVREVRWHTREDFDAGREELGSSVAEGPV